MKGGIKIILIIAASMLLASCNLSIKDNLPDMITHLAGQVEPVRRMIFALAYTLGVWFVGLAILKLKEYGHMTVMMSTHASAAGAMAYLLIGVGLLFFPGFLEHWLATLWLDGDILPGDYGEVVNALIAIVQVFGLISFLRGWVSLSRLGHSGSPPGTLTKGLMHMLGGILAINMTGTIKMLQATLGISS